MWHTLERESKGRWYTHWWRKKAPSTEYTNTCSQWRNNTSGTHNTQNTDVNVAMVNGCAHQRRREETRDTKEAGTGNRIYRLLCHNHNIKGAKEFDPAFYFFSFLLSSRLGAMEETKHVRKLPVQLLKNCGARQGQTRCCCCRRRSKQEIQLGVAHKAHGNTKQMQCLPLHFQPSWWWWSVLFTCSELPHITFTQEQHTGQ